MTNPYHQLLGRIGLSPFKSRVAKLALAVCSMALVSCQLPYTPDTLRQRGLKPGEGLIVGSYKVLAIGPDGKKTTRSQTDYSAVFAKPVKGGIQTTLQGRTQNGEVEIFAQPVPAGDYLITGWSMTGTAGTGLLTVKNRKPMAVPFHVSAGEAVYVGRMNAVMAYGRHLFGGQAFGSGLVMAADHFEKDAAWIAKDYPMVPRQKIRRSDAPQVYNQQIKRMGETPPTFWENLFPGFQ